jgi:subtilisin
MRRRASALLMWLALSLAGCAGQGKFPALPEPQAGSEERRILVTFTDRSIGRALSANPVDAYQAHGGYANSGWSLRQAEDLAGRHQLKLVAQWPVTALGVACVVYEVPAGRTIGQVLRDLQQDQQVEMAQPMQTFRVLGGPSSKAAPADPYQSLQSGYRGMRIGSAHRYATGKGVRVAVIDTGVDARHPDLAGQIAATENLAPLAPGQDTADIHGTAVAGVLAAHAGNGIGIAGIAPGADIYALRACWPERPGVSAALCNSFTLALALNEAIRLEAQVINMSLTGTEDPLLRKLVEKALEKGLIVVAAAPAAGQPGGFPANVDGVVAVRNAPNSATGALAVPGDHVLTTLPQGAYDFMSGSSFSAPQVAGLFALLLEVRPGLSAHAALGLLRGSLSPTEPRWIDACAALAKLSGANPATGCI